MPRNSTAGRQIRKAAASWCVARNSEKEISFRPTQKALMCQVVRDAGQLSFLVSNTTFAVDMEISLWRQCKNVSLRLPRREKKGLRLRGTGDRLIGLQTNYFARRVIALLAPRGSYPAAVEAECEYCTPLHAYYLSDVSAEPPRTGNVPERLASAENSAIHQSVNACDSGTVAAQSTSITLWSEPVRDALQILLAQTHVNPSW